MKHSTIIHTTAWTLFKVWSILLFSSASLYGQVTQGVNKERLQQLDRLITEHIRQQHIPGASALIIRNGEIIYNKAFGYADIAAQRPMQTNSIFRIASQSKAITSLAAMMLWEEGHFLLDDPISKWIPAFKDAQVLNSYDSHDTTYTTRTAAREITVRDLLRHTSGIAYPAVFSDHRMWAIYMKAGVPSGIGTTKGTLKESVELMAKQPLQHDPGTAFTYGYNTDILGYLVEIWSGLSLEEFFHKRIFTPLEMQDTYLHIPAEKQARLVTLYESKGAQLVRTDHPIYEGVDPQFPNLNGTYLSGGAGLSSTTGDYARFLSLILNKGSYKGKRLVSRKTIALMLTNQLPEGVHASPFPAQAPDFQFGLGFELETAKNDYLQPYSIGTFSWGGAFNTHYWADPKEQLIGLIFTQEYLSPYWRIGEAFKVGTYQALQD
ncbi:beta-lactamase family protein [Chitinophaga pendula]|uniref:serine hydrolase domain-containing protein n=1 Tax=Chitinophaga TaxID=79328 RepID=UPI000BAEBDCE|nr:MULTISPECIES: serine hydrolase domain-containing protein [Chitinophaga]ASZ14176.1 serine hydrolase [Chitinophaga sp. MD30]UCJ08188.1 beta-lactamase family protein [Chitinophaga pendula]